MDNKIIDMLTKDSVSIVTQKMVEIDGEYIQAGQNHRRAYINSELDRNNLQNNEPDAVVNAVLAIWGTEPTIVSDSATSETEE